MICAKNIT